MKKVRPEQKPCAVSHDSGRKARQDQLHFKARSFTDLFSFFRTKTTKKRASANLLSPLEERYDKPSVPPELPPKKNHYYLSKTFDRVQVNHVYEEIHVRRSSDPECGLWITIPAHEPHNQKAPTEVKDTDSEEVVDGPIKSTTATHKRNSSGWSFGSFHIGTPVELMSEVLIGDEWEQFLEDDLKFPRDSIQPDFGTKQEIPQDERDRSSLTNTGVTGLDVEDIMQSVKIIQNKEESPKVLKESTSELHPLPPPLPLSSSSSNGIHTCFRSSIFYRY